VPDVIIVGGGSIGCATAYYLAREGAGVTVLERGEVSGESSGAAAGMLAALSDEGERPPVFSQLCSDSLQMFESLLPVLRDTGIDIRHRTIDILHLAVSSAEAAALKEFEQGRSQGSTWLEAAEVRRLEPSLSPREAGAMVTPDAQYVDPLRFTQALAAAARREGATILEHAPAIRLFRRANRVRAVQTPGRTHAADIVLLAGGPWTMALAGKVGANVPTRPVRGQMLSLDSPPGGLQHMIWGTAAYLIPREDNQTYVGATVEEAGYRKRTTRTGLGSLRSGAASLVPHFRGAKQRSAWAGLRPGSPDDMPIMGRLPGWQNVWVSTGHYRNGILLAPVAGRLMQQAMLTTDPDTIPSELSPARFAE
jgi:glycine oxidase